MFAEIVAWMGAAWFCLAAGLFAVTIVGTFAQPVVQRRRARRRDQPPVSIILPIKQLHSGFAGSQTSAFEQDYATTEVLFSAQEASSPALDAALGIAAAHPATACQILQSRTRGAASPKLNNLGAPLEAASHDFLFMKDSNITLERDDVAAFMRSHTGAVGLVCGVPVAVRPHTYAGHVEAFSINGHARILLAASTLGLGFGIGKAVLMRRSHLDTIGGVASISHTIAEDNALSKALAAKGLTTVFSEHAVAQEIGERSLREVFERQARWCVIRRAQEPLTYLFEPLSMALPAACAAGLAAPLIALPVSIAFAGTLIGWCGLEIGTAALKGWGVSPWMPAAFVGREFLSLSAWLRGWMTRAVVWADERLDVREGERQAPVDV